MPFSSDLAAVCPAQLRRIGLEAARSVAPALAEAFHQLRTGVAEDGAEPSSVGQDVDREQVLSPTRDSSQTSVVPPAQTKSNHHDLVTEWDRTTEATLIRHLTKAVPGSDVLGEESGTHRTDSSGSELRWIIDPIDGTSNFVHGFPLFSISIAAELHGEVVAGVVVDPVNRHEFSADDAGTYLNDQPLIPREVATHHLASGAVAPGAEGASTDSTTPLDAIEGTAAEAALNLTTSFPAAEILNSDAAETALSLFAELVNTYATVRRTVSGALELCYTAAGWFDVTLGVDSHLWDVAAGQFILRQAGGEFHDCGPRPGTHYVGTAAGRHAPVAHRVVRTLSELSER